MGRLILTMWHLHVRQTVNWPFIQASSTLAVIEPKSSEQLELSVENLDFLSGYLEPRTGEIHVHSPIMVHFTLATIALNLLVCSHDVTIWVHWLSPSN